MLSGASFGDAGTSVVVEEYLDGYELSVLLFVMVKIIRFYHCSRP